jgi:UDP-glucose 4-epimerase
MRASFFIVGGAGFIGGHFVDRLLAEPLTERVTIFDNFSSGSESHYEEHLVDPRLTVVRGDAKQIESLREAMDGSGIVIHLASNPDIARAVTDPDVDFREGTLLTRGVLEAMRTTSAKRILYASGSGVYGDLGELEVSEDHGPLRPISSYGASKLAGEALISAYSHMFGLSGCIFRFGNVVGARQTHGVGFDFVRRLRADPSRLQVLGDGTQSKSYIAVEDVMEAVLLANGQTAARLSTYNVATGDYLTVREIADLALEAMGLNRAGTKLEFSTEPRGWLGDVPVVRLNTDRIRGLGWSNRLTSKQAVRKSIAAMVSEGNQ